MNKYRYFVGAGICYYGDTDSVIKLASKTCEIIEGSSMVDCIRKHLLKGVECFEMGINPSQEDMEKWLNTHGSNTSSSGKNKAAENN